MKEDLVFFSVFLLSVLHLTPAFPQSGVNRSLRAVSCKTGLEYQEGGICCSLCPAGTHVKSHCTEPGHRGQCDECADGTFTEHDNHLPRCLMCTPCRSDQEVSRFCSHTQDGECRCRPGRFCPPDEACELCKKCLRCKEDEEVVRNCTSTTNTECKKVKAKPGSSSDNTVPMVLGVVGVVVAAALIGLIVFVYFRRRSTSDSATNQPNGMKNDSVRSASVSGDGARRHSSSNLIMIRPNMKVKVSAGMEEERVMLCESGHSSTSNSQHSLTNLPTHLPTNLATNLLVSAALPVWDTRREEEFPELVAVQGERSLRACFKYFEELSCAHYKRFFRSLDLTDNVIRDRDAQQYEDRIHELLNVWVERRGRDASINELLQVLLALDQRLTAEQVKDRALRDGHYRLRSPAATERGRGEEMVSNGREAEY